MRIIKRRVLGYSRTRRDLVDIGSGEFAIRRPDGRRGRRCKCSTRKEDRDNDGGEHDHYNHDTSQVSESAHEIPQEDPPIVGKRYRWRGTLERSGGDIESRALLLYPETESQTHNGMPWPRRTK